MSNESPPEMPPKDPYAKKKGEAKTAPVFKKLPLKLLPETAPARKPEWIRVRAGSPSTRFYEIESILREHHLHTVCEEASCPNIGECFDSLLVGESACSPYLRRAVRSSMGAIFRLPVLEVADLAGTLRLLRERAVRCLAVDPDPGCKRLGQADLRGDCCLVFGNEGEGISAARAGGVYGAGGSADVRRGGLFECRKRVGGFPV